MVCLRQNNAEDLHFTVIHKIQNSPQFFNRLTFSLKNISNGTKHKHYFKGNGVLGVFCKEEVNNSEKI